MSAEITNLHERARRAGIEDIEFGTAEEIEAAIQERRKYGIDSLSSLLNERQDLHWTVEHWLESGISAVMVGPEGSFKSFVAIDWSMHIATGKTWQGCRVSPGRVLYIAGEGRTGVIRRMRGWCIQHEAVADDLFLGREPICLIGEDSDRIALCGKFQLVVIDTLARNFGAGNENDARDMGVAIREADRIREATGASVLIVHHTPLEGRDEGRLRPRGSSALSGATDAIFTCQYDKESKVIKVGNTKQKDAPTRDTMFLSFDVIDLEEQDNFGNPITTVVLCETDARPATNQKVIGKHRIRLLAEIRKQANGEPELLVAVRDITKKMNISSRAVRIELEKWFTDQPWTRPSVGGHIVDLEQLPHG